MLENTILANLLYNADYFGKVFPYLKEEYFEEYHVKKLFATLDEYVAAYKEAPSMEALFISLEKRRDMNEEQFAQAKDIVNELELDEGTNQEWLVAETEKFCQDRDLFNAVRRAILILDGEDKEYDKGAIPQLLQDSLGVSFDTNIGHDFLEDADARFEYYTRVEERLPFDIEILNKITQGGLPRKSLTLLLATTGAGKSLVKCHMAAAALTQGKNVLYVTAELSEEEVGRRIDANMMTTNVNDLKKMDQAVYQKRIKRIKDKTLGKLIIKEYPTTTANAAHIRHLLNELRLKKGFVPDIIFIDYLNIMASTRIKGAAAANSYTLVKSIAEEMRGLAMEFNVPIVSSSQLNRGGYENADVDLTNTSESMGITHTADAIFALITSEELEQLGQLMIKQLKNRWGDLSYYRRFVVGINRAQMKLHDLEENAQGNVQNEPTIDPDDDSAFGAHKRNRKRIEVGDGVLS